MTKKRTKRNPATSPQSQEQRCISLSYQLAEQMLEDGTAPPSIVAHFLKMGSSSQQIDTELKSNQAVLAKSKAESITAAESNKEVAEKAIEALKGYKVEE
nr:MAG TPA: hypothetical protein [Caudoviricetes sp.]